MPPKIPSNRGDAGPNISLPDEVSASLHAARLAINREIGSYPAPIPACDAQFNGLLERRRLMSDAIRNIDAWRDNGAPLPMPEAVVHAVNKVLNEIDPKLAGRLKAASSKHHSLETRAR
jgi:hypothetical protein